MKFKKILAAVGCFAVFAASGCSVQYKTFGKTFFAMNATAIMAISCESDRESDFDALCAEVDSVLENVEKSLSASLADSYVSKFNAAAAGARVEIDEIAYTVLGIAKTVYEETSGYYNPAVYYSVIAYGFGGAAKAPETVGELPSDEKVGAYAELASHFGELALVQENGAYYAVKPNVTVEIDGAAYSMKIDLGGIGKGYATDLINELIGEYGFEYGYFNFASSSLAMKKNINADSGNYTLGFTNPRKSNVDYATIPIKDALVSSSGDYEQYYIIDGVRYCHIIDPATGSPVQTGIMTATVIGGTAAENDALTTALIAMGIEKAVDFVNTCLTDRQVVITYDSDGAYKVVTNIDGLTLTDSSFRFGSVVEDGKIVLGD